MLLKMFTFVFEKLVGRLPEEKREKAWELFKELLALLVEKGAEGAVNGLKNG